MVVQRHQRARVHFGAQRTSRIGHEQHFAAQQLDGAHGGSHHCRTVAFVEVAAALQADNLHACQRAQYQLASVAMHGGDRETWQFVEGDRHCIGHLFGQHAQAGAQDHCNAWLEIGRHASTDDGGCLEWGIGRHGVPRFYIFR